MDFLKALFDKILAVFPQIYMLTPYEAGIRITFGKRVKAKEAGWYLIWPLIHRFVWMEINSQIIDLRNQSIRTKDNRDIVVSGAVQYCVKDVQKAICNIQDVDKAITTLSLGIILEFVSSHNLDECSNKEELKKEILKGLRYASVGWGIKIERIYITDLGGSKKLAAPWKYWRSIMDNYSIDNSGNKIADTNCADPVAASGVLATLTTAGNDYTATLVSGQMYIVTPVVAAGTVLASITGVTSTAANREWVWAAGQTYIFRMPIGKTTLYLESDVNATLVYFRKLAG